MNARPIALTSGDPAGIGPEITAAAWQALRGEVAFYLIGDPAVIAARSDIPTIEIADPGEALAAGADGLPVSSFGFAEPVVAGRPSRANAAQVIGAIERAVGDVVSGRAAALCTNPIAKSVLKSGAGFAYPGHTEFIAALTGGAVPVMMLAGPDLRVVPATIHIPLAQVPAQLTPARLEATIEVVLAALVRDFRIKAPRIAVAGLNPHAGEDGMMGHEDADLIAPVCAAFAKRGVAISGPLPADTMFHPAARARYDAAICMYHDQALIPLKTLSFADGVNVTLGLPIVRTSPDHGTAFDIAGRGRADPSSLIAALRLAAQMAAARAAP